MSIMIKDVKVNHENLDNVIADCIQKVRAAQMKSAMQIKGIWKRKIYKYFNASQTSICAYDNRAVINGKWKSISSGGTVRPVTGSFGSACQVSVNGNGDVVIGMKKIPQYTSKDPKWAGADVGQFQRRGTRPSVGKWDPPSGVRKTTGTHPGFSNYRWVAFMKDFKPSVIQIVRSNLRREVQ